MRNLLLIFALLPSLVFAQVDIIERSRTGSFNNMVVYTLCIDGYKFIVTTASNGRAITQAYETQDGKALPATCKNKS